MKTWTEYVVEDKSKTINMGDVYKRAEKIAEMPRKARRLAIAKVLKDYPSLNPYDFNDIIDLYLTATDRV